MSDEKIPYIKWGDYHSKDKDNPDRIIIEVVDPTPFDSEYSINVKVRMTENGSTEEKYLPLKSHESVNASLLKMWTENVKEGRIKKGTKLVVKTWLGLSKNNRPIRRYELEF